MHENVARAFALEAEAVASGVEEVADHRLVQGVLYDDGVQIRPLVVDEGEEVRQFLMREIGGQAVRVVRVELDVDDRAVHGVADLQAASHHAA